MRGVQWQEENTPTSTSRKPSLWPVFRGATIQAVAADLGINAHMLGKWREAMKQHDEKDFLAGTMPGGRR